jgi:pimeloyl-ACP methyl ester carboxylesterase
MRLAAKWRTDWTWDVALEMEPPQPICIGGEWVDVVQVGRGKPLVLVPGLAGGWKLLWPLAQGLARHFAVWLVGLRGDGDPSSGLEGGPGMPWDLEEYAHDLKELIDRLGLSCPAVMGVSFGGAVALEYAVRYPQGLSSLVVNGADSRFRTTMASTIARRVLERYPLPSDSPFVNQFFHLLYGRKPDPGPVVDFVVERIWETDQGVMARRLAQLESFDLSEDLWRIDVPTLVLGGSRDVIVPTARQRALADAIAGARFQAIEDAGHVGFLTHRAEVVRAVRCHHVRIAAKV